MLCRVEMPTNEQVFGRFYRYQLMHDPRGGSARMGFIMMPVLAVLVGLFLWYVGLPIWLPVALVAVVAAWLVYSLYLKPGMLFRKKEGAALQTEVTLFTDNSLTHSVRSEEGGLPENNSVQYTGLVQAVETNHDFFLFTTRREAVLIDKEFFTKGSPEELRETLKQRMGSKFKTKQK